jgi:hypothetical protein
MDAVFGEEFIEEFRDGLADGGCIGGEFGKEEGGGVGILVSDEILSKVPVTFFSSEDEEAAVFEAEGSCSFFRHCPVVTAFGSRDGFFVFAELLSDIFEPGEDIDDFNAVAMSDCILELGRDEGFDHDGMGPGGIVDPPEFRHGLAAVPGKEGPDLVAGEEAHVAGSFPDSYTHAVTIGVGGNDDVCTRGIGLINSESKGFGIFRVR